MFNVGFPGSIPSDVLGILLTSSKYKSKTRTEA